MIHPTPAPHPDDSPNAESSDKDSLEDVSPDIDSGPTNWVLPALRDCWYLTGPTCSGKTSLAIAVAQRMKAEIISLDSMAIYRGMDIGTAKPNAEQREQVPHHLIDIVEPTASFSVSSYVEAAHRQAAEVHQRGKRVLFVGGTPLYLKSLIRGLFLGPEADWEFRNSVEADIKDYGEGALRQRLMQVDPLLAHKLHPHDHRRMIRALEVARVTGRPLSHWQEQFESPAPAYEFPVAVLRLDRAWLHERINGRVENMQQDGLANEVQQLLSRHGQLGRTAAQAVGYREMLDHLAGKTTADETTELIKAHTRQFARRQEIWFRGLRELQPIEVTRDSTLNDLADRVCAIFENSAQARKHADGS